jgi:hypothetical protein
MGWSWTFKSRHAVHWIWTLAHTHQNSGIYGMVMDIQGCISQVQRSADLSNIEIQNMLPLGACETQV